MITEKIFKVFIFPWKFVLTRLYVWYLYNPYLSSNSNCPWTTRSVGAYISSKIPSDVKMCTSLNTFKNSHGTWKNECYMNELNSNVSKSIKWYQIFLFRALKVEGVSGKTNLTYYESYWKFLIMKVTLLIVLTFINCTYIINWKLHYIMKIIRTDTSHNYMWPIHCPIGHYFLRTYILLFLICMSSQ